MIHGTSSPLTAVLNTNTSLFCVATGYPLPTVHWLKNGDYLTLTTGIQALTINASSIVGAQSIVTSGGESVPVDGSLANLLTAGDVSLIGELGSVGLLLFDAVQRNDTANYSCIATNMLPKTGPLYAQSETISLTILGNEIFPLRSSNSHHLSLTFHAFFFSYREA